MSWVYLLFFISGFPALIYQIVWQRSLFTIYGVNIESITIVVSAFMLGLGLGSLLGGVISKMPGVPMLVIFGVIELSIGLYGAASLRIFHWVGVQTAGVSTLATGMLTFVLVVAPTTLMGATLPILTAHLVRMLRNVGSAVGMLYFVNTLGSGAACFVSAMFTMRLLGQSGSVMFAAAINFAAAVAALTAHFLTRGSEPAAPAVEPERTGLKSTALLPFPVALCLAGVAGFIALSYEILWYRAYYFVSAGQAYAFPMLLGAYLVGVAFGSLFAKVICSNTAAPQNPLAYFRIIGILVFAASVTGFVLVPFVAFSARSTHYVSTLPLVTLSAGLMGAVFPLLTHISVAPDSRSGSRLSYLYLANIVGSTLGTFLVGFVLMDHWSLARLCLCMLMIGLVMATAIGLKAVQGARRFLLLGGAAGLILGAVFVSGRLYDSIYEQMLYKFSYKPGIKFAHLVENKSGVVAVTDDGKVYGGGIYDGQYNTSLVSNSNLIVRAYAMIGFHPNPRQVLVIGLASGSWTQVITHHPSVEHVTIVEINPGYLQLIPKYPSVASLLRNPKVDVNVDDGRRWLMAHPERKFDLIVSNTTFNWRDHASNLLSREFLELIRQHLAPGGTIFYNTTDSGEVMLTGATVYPYALRVINFLAVSDSPLIIDKQVWRDQLVSYKIDGEPVLDLARAEDRQALDKALAMWDSVGTQNPASASMELADTIRQRFRNKRIITDDNMGTEWQ